MASSEGSNEHSGETGAPRAAEAKSGEVPRLGLVPPRPGTTAASIGHILVPLDGSPLAESILPVVAYAAFGTSMSLAVGPVAVISLMTASVLQPLAHPGTPEYVALAVQLALLSGLMLVVLGALRFGFIAQFLSQPVVAGFVSGSAILIALSQLKPLLGIPELSAIAQLNPATAALGRMTKKMRTSGPT